MNANTAELIRLAANVIELRKRVAALAREIDYVERTGAVPDPQKRVWVEQLSRIAEGHDEHCSGLNSLVED